MGIKNKFGKEMARIVVEADNNVKTKQGHSQKQYQSQTESRGNKGHYGNKGRLNYSEDSMADYLDNKRAYEKMAPFIEELMDGRMGVKDFITKMNPAAAVNLAKMALGSESEKIMLDAIKHMLGIDGHVPTQKHEIGRLDPETPKNAILSQISGMTKELAEAGIEIIDDREDED